MPATLSERLADHTRQLIVTAGVELLESASVGALTVRAVAAQAGMSERTVFRHFANRDELLDAVAAEVSRRMDLPPPPDTPEALLVFPRHLYARFEATSALTQAALHSELFPRFHHSAAHERLVAVRRLIDAFAPEVPARERALVAANIRHFLSATTWHYYRVNFGLDQETTIACAQLAVKQMLEGLARR